MTVRPTGSLVVMGYSALARWLSILDCRANAVTRSAVYKKTGKANTPTSHMAASLWLIIRCMGDAGKRPASSVAKIAAQRERGVHESAPADDGAIG